MPKKIFIILILTISLGLMLFGLRWAEHVEAGTEHNVWGWAWSAKEVSGTDGGIGWISFNAINCAPGCAGLTCVSGGGLGCLPAGTIFANHGVNIDDEGKFSGYAWSSSIGWIKFDPTTFPPEAPNHSAQVDLNTREVSGWVRACAAVENKGTCEGSSDPAAGGWDGWIKLRGITTGVGDYGVSINTTPDPNEFEGWAWGGGGQSAESAIIGWISFNCNNPETGNVCPSSNYKVITDFSFTPPVNPPNKPNGLDITWNHCGIEGLSIPRFHWNYSHPDNATQTARHIQIIGSSFDEIFSGPATSYALSNVLDYLNWGQTYNWRVRTSAAEGAPWDPWSEWSDEYSFTMPVHAHPWVNFNWSPDRPEMNQEVQFNDISTAFGGASMAGWNWIFEDGNPIDLTGPNPTTTFTAIRPLPGNRVDLYACDNTPIAQGGPYCCPKYNHVRITFPLPDYREVRPRSQLDNFLARLSSIFTGF